MAWGMYEIIVCRTFLIFAPGSYFASFFRMKIHRQRLFQFCIRCLNCLEIVLRLKFSDAHIPRRKLSAKVTLPHSPCCSLLITPISLVGHIFAQQIRFRQIMVHNNGFLVVSFRIRRTFFALGIAADTAIRVNRYLNGGSWSNICGLVAVLGCFS